AWGTPAGRWLLAATVLGSGMAFLDSTVVNVALPAIGADLGTGLAGLQWISNSYLLTLSALILLSGALGDRFGRVRVFAVGVAWFALASVLCVVASDTATLIAGRIAQGVGGALLTPGSLAILQVGFREEDRGRAIGAWSGLTGVASAVGPFVGGWLVDAGSWRLIFLLNIPLAVAVLLIAWRHLPESRDPAAPARLDYAGAGAAVVGLAGVTYALISAGEQPFAPGRVLVGGAAGLCALLAFVMVERRSDHPMLPLGVFGSVRFSAVNVMTVLLYGALGPLFFLLVIFLQEAMGYSALAAGAASLPITLLMLLLSGRSGRLAERIGPWIQLTLGPLAVAAGLVLLATAHGGSDYLTGVLPGVLVVGAGLAATVAPLTSTVLASAPLRHAGVASGVNNAVARSAQLIGVAAVPVLAGVTGPRGISGGFAPAMLILAGLSAAAGLLALALLRRERRAAAAARAPRALFCGATSPPLRMPPPERAEPGGGPG
ncbi:DHA2 family efflux MFS transporter permease subunit, partial [Marinitenerispora sediminis]